MKKRSTNRTLVRSTFNVKEKVCLELWKVLAGYNIMLEKTTGRTYKVNTDVFDGISFKKLNDLDSFYYGKLDEQMVRIWNKVKDDFDKLRMETDEKLNANKEVEDAGDEVQVIEIEKEDNNKNGKKRALEEAESPQDNKKRKIELNKDNIAHSDP